MITKLYIIEYLNKVGTYSLYNIYPSMLKAVEEAERLRDKNQTNVKVGYATMDLSGLHVRRIYEI